MDIDVKVFTPLAPVWHHIHGHALYLYIMGNAAVLWFGPAPPIGHQGTQIGQQNNVDDDKAVAMAMTVATIAIGNNAVNTAIEDDEGNHWRQQVWWRQT
jgi:hypothetical protein